MVNTSIWIKPSGAEVEVDSASYQTAASLGWKPKDEQAEVVAEKKAKPKTKAKV